MPKKKAITFAFLFAVSPAFGQSKRAFSPAEEVQLWRLIPDGARSNVLFSPDGKYFAVYAAHSRIDLNRPEDCLRIYRSRDVKDFVQGDSADERQPPSPIWVIRLSSDDEGVIIDDWRWLSDSSGVAFLQRMALGRQRLVLADISRKTIEPLTSTWENVRQFDIRNRNHYAYTALNNPDDQTRTQFRPFLVGTGRQLYELVLPDDRQVIERFSRKNYVLRAVVDGKRVDIKKGGVSIVPIGDLAMSPDGRLLVTRLSVDDVPKSWETSYPPPPSQPYPIRAGRQQEEFYHPTDEYVLVDFSNGLVEPLTGTPSAFSASWQALGSPDWSGDSKAVVLPGAFITSKAGVPSRPCITVVDLPSKACTCVEMLKGSAEAGFHVSWGGRFANGDNHHVLVQFTDREHAFHQLAEYRRTSNGDWTNVGQTDTNGGSHSQDLTVTVKQGIDNPPLLVASVGLKSRVIWDPNPQLKNLALGEATVYNWRDKEGRFFKGGLYKPVDYKLGERYPLVIQTHGFDETLYMPAGTAFPNGFAARALAAFGFVVLQVNEACPSGNPSEGACSASAYESGARQLISDGLADPTRIGIIGFSRSCFYVMETLTTGSIQLKAALITDGWMVSYSQYMQWPSWFAKEGDAMIGAAPFGNGLRQWLKFSPEFNISNITTPLLVVGDGPLNTLLMWQPYAALHHLKRPVDFIMLNTHEHILTNPAVRMASQQGSVDWFRFWLQDYEDPDPSKAAQYVRWRELRKLQEENAAKTKVQSSN